MNLHGKIAFSWQDDLFTLLLEGPFNEPSVKHHIELLKESVVNRSKDRWRRLEIWDEEVLGSPESIALAKEVYDWYEVNGCQLVAVVVCNKLQVDVIKNMMDSKAEVFSDLAAAKQWLEKRHNS